MLIILALATTLAQPPEKPANTIQIGADGFITRTADSAPFVVWATNDEKKLRPDAQITIENTSAEPFRVFFQLDLPIDPATGRRAPIDVNAAGVSLVNCPMVPGVCGQVEVAARRNPTTPGTATIPAR